MSHYNPEKLKALRPGPPPRRLPKRWWASILALAALLGLFAMARVSSASTIVEDFDECSLGNLNNCGNWQNYDPDIFKKWQVSQGYAQSGTKSITTNDTGAFYNWLPVATTSYAAYRIYFYATESVSGHSYFEISDEGINIARIGIEYPTDRLVLSCVSTTTEISATTPYGEWHYLEIDYDSVAGYIRGRLDTGSWQVIETDPTWLTINRIIFENNGVAAGRVYWDTLEDIAVPACDSTCLFCSPAECLARSECLYLPGPGYCIVREPTCDNTTGCFYCTDEASCEAKESCFWRTDTCFWGTPTATSSSFIEYWTNAGTGHATPTEWAISIGDFMGGIFDKANGFFNLLSVSTTEGIVLGTTIGSAVPTIRGYLEAIISFLQGLGGTLPLWDFLKLEIGVVILLIVIKVIMMIRKFIW